MHYNKRYEIIPSQIQGTSLTRSLAKEGGVLWGDTESGTFVMTNSSGTGVITGSLTKSQDSTTLTFDVQDDETTALLGKHTLWAYATDTADDTVKMLIGKFVITYETESA